jgi:hypothetical protein
MMPGLESGKVPYFRIHTGTVYMTKPGAKLDARSDLREGSAAAEAQEITNRQSGRK